MTQSQTIQKRTGLNRIIFTFANSYRGIRWMIQNEAAFQQELMLFVPLTAVAVWLPISFLLKALLICSLLFILFSEMANTAIEATVDRIGTDFHPLSGLAKDIGSACVLISFIIATIIWIAVILSIS
ncbi:diacylglycerol kinase [Vibrio parahaemolyticus]|uniref:diacylglycerol kinase n=3 Tax=Vibrio parahaemolyticus TaxID=670 RepID=UPI00040C6D7C|nr:diacylglycerol kinase [Vibrio parahaemolyticus]EGQ7866533.1 diacylglycerol kinase [Vibrio parahaemolyticus]EGQ7884220.1 diacylglycerol kinase [Vibrio parahaemolyticus]EGQ7886480.1 diacylglycerol kinase [Vibrio parahaemolyticus]EGQ8035610.1 diacylglycerol kinase [Vibrio parahaemolyticus]EGQ9248655.1 diacylglycerol kinase [Vibrio parahaemolyticus]